MIYFSSDWHLNHKNIIKYSKRPFSNIKEMNAAIINNFYQIVDDCSDFYFLGDFSFISNDFNSFFEKLPKNIRFHFIRGNHDKNLNYSLLKKYCTSITDGYKDIIYNGQKITLCHYPMYAYNCSHFGAWMLHGHIHENISDKFYGKILNVGVDVNKFSPISFSEVEQLMKNKKDNWDLIKK